MISENQIGCSLELSHFKLTQAVTTAADERALIKIFAFRSACMAVVDSFFLLHILRLETGHCPQKCCSENQFY